jgi:hypothetical protein
VANKVPFCSKVRVAVGDWTDESVVDNLDGEATDLTILSGDGDGEGRAVAHFGGGGTSDRPWTVVSRCGAGSEEPTHIVAFDWISFLGR